MIGIPKGKLLLFCFVFVNVNLFSENVYDTHIIGGIFVIVFDIGKFYCVQSKSHRIVTDNFKWNE